MGLNDSKVREPEVTSFALQRVMIRVGKPNRDELDWAICVIWKEMKLPRSSSIFITSPYIRWAWSTLRSEVWEVGSFRRIFHEALLALRIILPPDVHSFTAMV